MGRLNEQTGHAFSSSVAIPSKKFIFIRNLILFHRISVEYFISQGGDGPKLRMLVVVQGLEKHSMGLDGEIDCLRMTAWFEIG